MAARSAVPRNAEHAADCCNKAVFKGSMLSTAWQNDLQQSCRTIACREASRELLNAERGKSPRKSTEPKRGYVNVDVGRRLPANSVWRGCRKLPLVGHQLSENLRREALTS